MVAMLRNWLAALLDGDNPLTQYYTLAERRRRAKVSALRRHGALLATVLLSFALATLVIVEDQGRNIPVDTWNAVIYLMIAVPVCYVWCVQGLYHAAQGASGLLGVAGRRLHLVVDDMLALSSLSDRQLVAGTLRILMPPLIVRAVGASLLVWSVVLLETLEFGAGQPDERTVLALTTGPLTIGGMALVSSLALLLLVLWWIAHGRGLRTAPLIGTHIMLQALLLPLWLSMSYYLVALGAGVFGEELDYGGLMLYPLVAVLLLVPGHSGILKFGLRSHLARAVLLVSGPALVPVVLILLLGSLSETLFWDLPELVWPILLWTLSAVQPLSLNAVPLGHGVVVPHVESWNGAATLAMPYHYALLLVVQLGLLLLTARAAESSVGLHRRSA